MASPSTGRRQTLNEIYPTAASEITGRLHEHFPGGCCTSVEKAQLHIIKNRLSRIDHERPPQNVIPTPASWAAGSSSRIRGLPNRPSSTAHSESTTAEATPAFSATYSTASIPERPRAYTASIAAAVPDEDISTIVEDSASVRDSTPVPDIASPVRDSTPVPDIASPVRDSTPVPDIASPVRDSTPVPDIASPLASMPPGIGRQDKKAGRVDAGRASASRNTTPSSIAGSVSVDSTNIPKSRYFGSRINPKSSTFNAHQALVDAPAGSGAPDIESIDVLEKYSEALHKDTKHDVHEYISLASKVELLQRQVGLPAEEDNLGDVQNVEEADVKTEVDPKPASGPDKKAKKTKRKKAADRPLAHGAHAVAVQDGSHIHDAKALKAHGPSRDPDTASSSLSPAQTTPAAAAAAQDQDVDAIGRDENMEDVQPLPTRILVEKPTFGDDPTRFDDPTVYEIVKVQPGMSDAKIKELASVQSFPRSSLSHLTAGSPPDRDFSNNKPANQVQATTFASHSEQYLRPFTEEDSAWLRERGDRVTPFTMPPLGKKPYKEVWADEDGFETSVDIRQKHATNEARGSMDDMNDSVAETDELSTGPAMVRLLGLFRHERRQLDDSSATNAGNGDEDAGEINDEPAATLEAKPASSRTQFPPATRVAEPASESGKRPAALSPEDLEQRVRQEMIFAGLMPENAEPAYHMSEDDEVAAKIRKLQAELKVVSLQNAARKSILQERMTDQMAHQEYNHIGDDLDTQVTNHYQKRSRTMGKKNKKRSGGAGGGANAASGSMVGVAKPGLEGATKVAMDRRKNWKEKVGTVFDDPNLGKVPRASDEGSSIFTPEAMARHMAREAANWDDEDGEGDDE